MSCNNCGGKDIKTAESEAIGSATKYIKRQKDSVINLRLIICCLTILLIVAMICATVLGVTAICKQQQTIIEQQYALNMQYAGLLDYVSGAEITTTTETIDGSGGGIAAKIEGDNNTIGGDN